MAESGALFVSAEAAAWAEGGLYGDSSVPVVSAETDSRRCGEGFLFFALKGERVDGHDFIGKAFQNGACGAVVSSEWEGVGSFSDAVKINGRFFIFVSSPLDALQKIASSYMKTVRHPVRIGVTGSNGKTTTKELIASVLGEVYSVVKTEGNYNSEIGLPLTVFNINEGHDFAVIEMGINRVGEMDILAEILRPDIVVVTNIGTAHIGAFETIENTAYEKRRAVSFFDKDGLLFVDEDDGFSGFMSEGHPGKTVRYGLTALADSAESFNCSCLGLKGWEIELDGNRIGFPLVGEHNLKNAVCALTVGRYLGLSGKDIKAGLEKSVPLFGRSEIVEGPVTVILDCYNSNADSLMKSLDFADELDWNGCKNYVIGDMGELGESSREIHENAGKAALCCKADNVFFFGPATEASFRYVIDTPDVGTEGCGCEKRPDFFHASDYSELEKSLISVLREGDLVLIKGSRSMEMERLLGPVLAKFGGEAC